MESEHLNFEETPTTGKTKQWNVVNKTRGDRLGIVKWHGAWRQFCYFPIIKAVYAKDCLKDIAEFIETQMNKRNESKRSESKRSL